MTELGTNITIPHLLCNEVGKVTYIYLGPTSEETAGAFK